MTIRFDEIFDRADSMGEPWPMKGAETVWSVGAPDPDVNTMRVIPLRPGEILIIGSATFGGTVTVPSVNDGKPPPTPAKG